MSPEAKTITLRDGRTFAFTEHGDLSGKPVLFIHGNPGSRNMRHPDETIAQSLNARIITPDRPGYGLSDFQPGRSYLDYPEDISQLMDALKIEKFAVLGVSAGGPYAAACAYKLPNRITRTAIVSSAAPINRENAYENLQPSMKTAFNLVKTLPGWLSHFILWLQTRKQQRDPEKSLDERAAMLSAADKATLARPEYRSQVLAYRTEAVRQGVRGMLREMQLLVSPWGFPLEDIRGDVSVWHWEDDLLVPVQMGRYLALCIPNVEAHFLPGGGHYSLFEHWREILASLLR
jgi:pimeloyl-ACP methyl ester carboxylesterase